MPTLPETHGAVMSICDSLEVSPSSHSPGSSIYNSPGEPEATPHSPKHMAGAKGHVTNAESHFGRKGKALRRNIAAGKKADSNKDV